MGLVSDVNTRYVLFFFGIWFILTGLYYRLPIPLEPMKAIAVIVIAGGIGSGEIVRSWTDSRCDLPWHWVTVVSLK